MWAGPFSTQHSALADGKSFTPVGPKLVTRNVVSEEPMIKILLDLVHLCDLTSDVQHHEVLPMNPEIRRFCIFSLTFSHDGHEVLGGANDGCLYVYDCIARQRTLRIPAHDDDVNAVTFADETSQILFSGADDGLCKVWDRRTLDESASRPVGIFAGHIDGITYIDSRGDGRHLITNSKDQ